MYLLDTNILSEIIKKRPSPYLFARLEMIPAGAAYTSSICVMELRYGSALRNDFDEFWIKIKQRIISRVNIVHFGEKESIAAGDILAELKQTGRMIRIEDVLIAASAISNNLVMVTANIRHFSRINGLVVEGA